MRKRIRKNIFRGWIFWFTLITAFSLVGFSLAGWQDELKIGGTATTGDVDVYFIDSWIPDNPPPTHCTPSIRCEPACGEGVYPKHMIIGIEIDTTLPGNRARHARFGYRVKNGGTVPVSVEVSDIIVYPPDADYTVEVKEHTLPGSIDAEQEIEGFLHLKIQGRGNFTGEITFILTIDYKLYTGSD